MTILRGYVVEIRRQKPALGGGFVAIVPALRGCSSPGPTPSEALAGLDASIDSWLDAAQAEGRSIPAPVPNSQLEY